MLTPSRISAALAVALFFLNGTATSAQSVSFNRDIRPILNDHCAGCHGGVKKNGGFSVLSRELLLSSTDSGHVAVVPGNAKDSPLMHRVSATDIDERMPPAGHDALTSEERQLLQSWINEGAVWPSHWAWQTIPSLPDPARFGGQHPIDWYVLRKLTSAGMQPSPPADAAVLVRRLSLDITGLLPDPAAAQALESVSEPFANTAPELLTIVDSLLALPHFGERWGRHWLDEARYADSEGYEKDSVKADAFRFRDWVINAVNDDMPFDDFTRKQLAGDLLPEASGEDLIATKFHLQTQFNLEGGVDSEEDRTKRVIDRVGTVAAVWMASSLACCQCHDHPYDSLRQRDFYRLYAFFNNADMAADFLAAPPKDADRKTAEREKRWNALSDLLTKQLTDKNQSDRTQSLLSQLRSFDNSSGFTRYLRQRTGEQRKTYVFTRGDFQRPMTDAGVVRPDIPASFGSIAPKDRLASRLDFANWMVSDANPLTPRVTVNKIWMHLFGRPLAGQPQEFGSRGSEPSHPELLDYLARWFVDEAGWSRKKLIRFIVTSKTYQQSSAGRPEVAEQDPSNHMLAKQNRFRVEAEIVRDISLQASGLLSRTVGGKSVFPPLPDIVAQQTYAGSNKYKVSKGEDRYRRGLYTFFRRTAIDPNLSTFDCPDSSLTRAQRDRSNNPLQALATMHNEVFHEAAQAFAGRLLKTKSSSDRDRLHHAFRITVGRTPRDSEIRPLLDLLKAAQEHFNGAGNDAAAQVVGEHAVADISAAENAAWVAVTRVVLNLDEFLTRS